MYSTAVRANACDPHLEKRGGSRIKWKVRLSHHTGLMTALPNPTGSLGAGRALWHWPGLSQAFLTPIPT